MKPKIVMIVDYPFTERDFHRYGVDLFQSEAWDVEIWDCGQILQKKYSVLKEKPFPYKHMYFFDKKLKVCQKILTLDKKNTWVLFLTLFLKPSSFWLYLSFSRSNIRYFTHCALVIPSLSGSLPGRVLKITPKKLIRFFYRKTFGALMPVIKKIFFPINPMTIIFGSGKNSIAPYLSSYPNDKSTKYVFFHQLDYDVFLQTKKSNVNDTILFIDGYEPFHDDYIVTGKHNPLDPDRYYQLLNDYFDYLESIFNLKVVIAAHPRSDYESRPNYFKERPVTKGNTVQLIQESQFVLMHASTSINYAVLYNKPVVFITLNGVSDQLAHFITVFSSLFKKPPIYIDQPYQKQDIDLSVDADLYKKYKEEYIKYPGSKDVLFWKQVSDYLKLYTQ